MNCWKKECSSAAPKIPAVAFWDVDAPATLARVEANPADAFRTLIPEYDFIFTYGGGAPVVEHYQRLGAANCHPIYNALDPETHHPVPPDPAFACDLLFVGHRLPDRERRVQEFFFRAAELAPDCKFALGGEGWGGKRLPANVRWIGHVGTGDHNRVNCSARMVLNINRDSMAGVGFSPPTRVFEAAGAGACLITDRWAGIETVLRSRKRRSWWPATRKRLSRVCGHISAAEAQRDWRQHARSGRCATIRTLCARRKWMRLLRVRSERMTRVETSTQDVG